MEIRLIEVPIDFGASRRGVDIGPTALRLAGLKETLRDLGHQLEEDSQPILIPVAEQVSLGDPRLKYLDVISGVCATLAQRVEKAKADGRFPLIMGGDHSLAIGTLAGLGSWYRTKGLRWGLVWIDAHGDFNTPETSPSGNIHGMPLAASVGLGDHRLTQLHAPFAKIEPENVVIIGLRDVDPGERSNLKEQRIKTYTMSDIDRLGIHRVSEETLRYLKARVDVLHVSFDVDSMDPETAPGVGTPVLGGLSYRETHSLMEALAASGLVGSIEVVEVNPLLDVRNQTAERAVEMLASLLGRTIL